MPDKPDYYELLGVSRSASADEIKRSYRQKALENHPDRNKSADAESKFKQINQAYEVLSNPKKRQAYDQFGHSAFDPASGFGGFGGQGQTYRQGPFTYTYYGGGQPAGGFGGFEGFSDPFEIFESFFGSAAPFGRTSGRRAKPHYSLKIDFMDAAKGGEKTVVISGKEHTIKIPAGADDGTRVSYRDFEVSFDVKPHPVFKRDGADLVVNLNLPLTTAVLGGAVSAPTIDGSIEVRVRPGTQSGTLVRLRGRGIPYLRSQNRGDQYLRLNVKIPEKLSHQEKDLFEQLRRLDSNPDSR